MKEEEQESDALDGQEDNKATNILADCSMIRRGRKRAYQLKFEVKGKGEERWGRRDERSQLNKTPAELAPCFFAISTISGSSRIGEAVDPRGEYASTMIPLDWPGGQATIRVSSKERRARRETSAKHRERYDVQYSTTSCWGR